MAYWKGQRRLPQQSLQTGVQGPTWVHPEVTNQQTARSLFPFTFCLGGHLTWKDMAPGPQGSPSSPKSGLEGKASLSLSVDVYSLREGFWLAQLESCAHFWANHCGWIMWSQGNVIGSPFRSTWSEERVRRDQFSQRRGHCHSKGRSRTDSEPQTNPLPFQWHLHPYNPDTSVGCIFPVGQIQLSISPLGDHLSQSWWRDPGVTSPGKFLGIPGLAHVGDQAGSHSRSCTHPDSCPLQGFGFLHNIYFLSPMLCSGQDTRNQEMYNQGPFSHSLGEEMESGERCLWEASVQGALDPIPLKLYSSQHHLVMQQPL